MKRLFIINPTSGGGTSVQKLSHQIQQIFKSAPGSFEIRSWENADGLDALLDDAPSNFDAVIAVGGDGTINAVAQNIYGKGLVLGVVPTGSGNGLARHLGIARSSEKSLLQLRDAEVLRMDVGHFGGELFLNNAGIGVDALIATRFDAQGGAGMGTYFRISFQTLLSYPGLDCRLTVDGEQSYPLRNMLIVDIANGPEWGGGAQIAPVSILHDGQLEAILLEKTSRWEMMRLGRMLFKGNIHQHPKYRVIRGRHFELERNAPGPAQVDGEPLRLPQKVVAEIQAGSLDILVPQG